MIPGKCADHWGRAALKSSSSTETSTTTQQIDERVAATDNAVVIQLSDGSSFELSDPGVLEAFNQAVSSYEDIVNKSLGFAGEQNERALSLTREVLEKNRSEQAQALTDLLKWGAVITIGVVAAVQAPKFIKG